MVLADTSIWIDHFRSSSSALQGLIASGAILIHPMIIGELVCGHLPDRSATLRQLHAMPKLEEARHEEVCDMIESRQLMGRGIGYIDAHLLCSVLSRTGVSLWTRDQRLNGIANALGTGHSAQ